MTYPRDPLESWDEGAEQIRNEEAIQAFNSESAKAYSNWARAVEANSTENNSNAGVEPDAGWEDFDKLKELPQ